MTDTKTIYDSARDDRVADLFIAAEWQSDLLLPSDPVGRAAARPSDLYEIAVGRAATLPRGLSDAERRDLATMLQRLAVAWCPRAAAASTGTLSERRGNGFVLRINASRADLAQSYVTIELDSSVGAVSSLLVVADEAGPERATLPEPEASAAGPRTLQIIAESQGRLISLLSRPESQVFLT